MSLALLTLDQWRSFDVSSARRTARRAAQSVAGRVSLVETVELLGGPLHRALVERDGQQFALIPGGTVRLGFDLAAWEPTPEEVVDYEEALEEGFAHEPDVKAHLAAELSPQRTVTLSTVLMAVEAEHLTEPPASMPAVLAARGLRMPSADEWEHACGAGARTLYRWGDACPLDEEPFGEGGGPRCEPNAFGLRIAHDTYRAELGSDPGAVHGGDGGEAVCGGYGALRAWLPLATANRNPSVAELVYGPDGEYVFDAFATRPVLTLP